MKAIIPTGGRGTRMQPITFSTNKHFVPVGNKPLVFYPIETIAGSGIKDVAITYNPGWLPAIKNLLGDGSKWGLTFTYVLQEEPKGLANIFQVCEEYLEGEPFVFHLGDNIFTKGIKDLVDYFQEKKPNAMVTMVKHEDNRRLGVPVFDEKGRLTDYLEKPENPPNDFAIPGLYFFDNNVFSCFTGEDAITPSERGEYEINSPFLWLIKHGFRVDVLEYKGKWLDPGKFDDWLTTNAYLLDEMDKAEQKSTPKNTEITGKVAIGENCEILDSKITGPVSIGNNVSIKNSEIGPHSSIYDGSQIEDSFLADSVLMSKVKIINFKRKIVKSILGTDAEVKGNHDSEAELFIGEKSKITI